MQKYSINRVNTFKAWLSESLKYWHLGPRTQHLPHLFVFYILKRIFLYNRACVIRRLYEFCIAFYYCVLFWSKYIRPLRFFHQISLPRVWTIQLWFIEAVSLEARTLYNFVSVVVFRWPLSVCRKWSSPSLAIIFWIKMLDPNLIHCVFCCRVSAMTNGQRYTL